MGAGKGLQRPLEGGQKLSAVLTPPQDTQLKPDTMQSPASIKPSKYGVQDTCTGYKFRVRTEASASARTEAQCYCL